MKVLGLDVDLKVIETNVIDQNQSDSPVFQEVEDTKEYYVGCTQYHKDMGPLITNEEEFNAARKTKWDELRAIRNSLLSESDWTQLPDVTLTDEAKAAWLEYRQALRDMIDATGNPFEAVWPEKP